ncbi:caspase domain-containing protein [Sphingobium indicum]|nr:MULTISPECIES: caspase family protein [Sphingobium]MCB4862118.1 caspase family protein [Sphingobium sp. PNB]
MRKGLFFGSNGSAHFMPLRYARSDAERVAKAFQMHGGFDAELVDTASVSVLRERLHSFIAETAECEAAVIYFAGHGECRRGELFLVLDNTNPGNFLGSALRCSEITVGLKFSEAKNKLLILDCCSAGTGAKGIRGPAANLTEVVHDSESFMIFAASEALEPTREHERWSGSFLSDLVVDALGKHRRLTLGQLNDLARTKAKQHQGDHPNERLSIPFMFGSESGRFSLTHRKPSAIVVSFDDQLENNLPDVLTQVRASKLAPTALRHVAQWQIEWPTAYDRRFEELAGFKAAGTFPTRNVVDPKPLGNMVDELSKRRASVEEFIARALRECLPRVVEANAESDDWRLTLDIALRSAVFLLGRSLYTNRFDAEGNEPWHEPFLHTELDWGSDIILGLAPVWTSLQADEPVLFWTDADYWVSDGERRRVYVPVNEGRSITRRLIFGTLGPQLLWANVGGIYRLEHDGYEADRKGDVQNLRVRNESFIEIEHFRFPDPNSDRLRQIERSIVDHFARKGFADWMSVDRLSRGSLNSSNIIKGLQDQNVDIQ